MALTAGLRAAVGAYQDVANSGAAGGNAVVIIQAVLWRGGIANRTVVSRDLNGNSVSVVRWVPRCAGCVRFRLWLTVHTELATLTLTLGRVATDIEVGDVTRGLGARVIVILSAELVQVPAPLRPSNVVVKDALVFLETVGLGLGEYADCHQHG